MNDILQKICATTSGVVQSRKQKLSLQDIKARIPDAEPPRGYIKALRSTAATGKPALIAEVKKASPSKGLIRADFDPVQIAHIYEQSGATCLSVLTDEAYFQGHDDYLIAVKNAVSLPVLRKDFMLEDYQIYESRMLGADCILLIVAALDDSLLYDLYALSRELGMDALIEVHDAEELERAKALKPAMIGVNNRNLKTLAVDINTSRILAPAIPQDCLKVAESGLSGNTEIKALQESGYAAFLVGESLMRQDDIGAATRALLGQ